MRKLKPTFFLLKTSILSILSYNALADNTYSSIYEQIEAINSNPNGTGTYNYQLGSNANELIFNTQATDISTLSYWPVMKPINWNINGSSQSEKINGSLSMFNQTNAVNGKLTIKNVGSLKSGVNYNSLENYNQSNLNGYITNLGTYLNTNGTNVKATEAPSVLVVNSNLDVENSIFYGATNGNTPNQTETGAAISIRKVNKLPTVDQHGNATTIDVSGTPTATVSKSYFIENNTNDNGAAINIDKSDLTLTESVFVKNTAKGHGGALDISGNASVSNNTFYKNNAQSFGGAVYVHPQFSLTSQNNSYQQNTASTADGGAISNFGSLVSKGDTFTNNTAHGQLSGGGAISNNKENIFDSTGAVTGVIRGTLVSENSNYIRNSADYSGGAIINEGQATITGGRFESNHANYGGAITNNSNTQQSDVVLNATDVQFKNNTSSIQGGAIYNNATTIIDGAEFNGNSSDLGGAVYNSGIFTLNNAYKTKFIGNRATNAGSAIVNTGTLNINNARDTIDLDYNPYTNETRPQRITRLFADGEDVYNTGTININNSDLQLHNSNDLKIGVINVAPTITNKKSGTINATNSRIDIGKSTLYADTINLYNGSELLTHVNAKSGNEFGKLEANTISVAQTGTDLTILVAAGEHLNPGESKVFKILDASNELTAAAENGFENITENQMYDIEYLGNGEYKLSRPDSDNPDSDNPDSDDPDSDNPDSDNPDSDNPDSDNPDSDNPDSDNPDSDNPDSDNPDSDNPDSDNPDSDNPDSDNPDSDNPDDGDTPICPNEGCIHNAWVEEGKMEGNETAIRIQNTLNEAAQRLGCDSKEYQDALAGIAPDVSPLIQAHSTEIASRLSALVKKHFSASMERTAYIHRGNRFYYFPERKSNLWVDGMYGKSEFDSVKGFDMDTKGIAVGLDGHISDDARLGIAYAYTMAEGEAVQRDTEIQSHTVMVYGDYNPSRFYTNWLALYTRSNYEEDKKIFSERVKAEYDVDVFGAQIMFGHKMGPLVVGDWATGVLSPEMGLRYTYLNQHDYTDQAGQKVSGGNGHILTGILGAQYTIGYALSPSVSWYPELRAAVTYDFIQPDMENSVTLVNGSRYDVVTENLDRFGIEIGAKVGLDINRTTELAIEYEGLFKGDYTNHTGLASLKYKF